MSQSKVFLPGLMAGEVALVTGGGTGIGAEIAREYARLGATVHLASRKQEVIEAAVLLGFESLGVAPSPLKGPKGNQEFLAHLRLPALE